MRHEHYIKSNEGNATPSQAIWFDTETDPDYYDTNTCVHRLRFGWSAYRRIRPNGEWTKPEYFRFTSALEFWTWVEEHARKKTTLYLFCHNTNFDLPVLDIFNNLPSMGWKLTRAIIDAPPTMLTFRKGTMTLKVFDTLNYWRTSLEELGKQVGCHKMSYPAEDASEDYWNEYGKQDVNVIMEACLRWWAFLNSNDMGNFAPTLAGQSLNTYRHRFMPARIAVHSNEDVLRLERASYHGGRTEAFRIGEFHGDLHMVDVTSMYPYVMQLHLYPARLAFYQEQPSPAVLQNYLPNMPCVALCHIRTDEPIYGVPHNGKLVFPVGEFVTALAGPEVGEALVRGHLLGVHRVAFYEPEDLFGAFVKEIWQLRLAALAAGDHVLATFYKLLMNSLYGKFGQNGMVWEEQERIPDLSCAAWQDLDAETGIVTKYRRMGGLVQALANNPESRESCPIIASYVTSYARLYLWKLIETAGRNHVYYCDTDSLIVDATGLDNLQPFMGERELGKLKIEASSNDLVIHGSKDYTFGNKWKCKGARSGSLWLDPTSFEQDQWSGLRGQLRKGALDRSETRRVVKHLTRHYDKGTVGVGGIVSPLVLSPDILPT